MQSIIQSTIVQHGFLSSYKNKTEIKSKYKKVNNPR